MRRKKTKKDKIRLYENGLFFTVFMKIWNGTCSIYFRPWFGMANLINTYLRLKFVLCRRFIFVYQNYLKPASKMVFKNEKKNILSLGMRVVNSLRLFCSRKLVLNFSGIQTIIANLLWFFLDFQEKVELNWLGFGYEFVFLQNLVI